MKKKFVSLALTAVMSAHIAMAVPAKRTPMVFTQPDGTAITLRKVGDERNHMTLTVDGYPVMRDASGYFCYADLDESGVLKPTAIKAMPLASLNSVERVLVEKIDAASVRKKLTSGRTDTRFSAPMRMGEYGGIGLNDDAFLGRKELTGLVILAQYSDVKFSDDCTREFFLEMLNEEGFSQFGGTGSARDYFIDSSNGQFVPKFDVYGPVTLSKTQAYYGANDRYGDDANAHEMIADACKGLDSQINFADYDLDGDGYVDNVFVFYAGYGEASYGSDDTVWPHQWELSSAGVSLTLDGVKIDKYACSNELELDSSRKPIPDGIGTFVHEFSHVLGLPDLYVTNADEYWTPGEWSVLDQGPYNNDARTPPAYSIYERNALGWIAPIVIDGPESISLDAITTSNQGCIIPTSNKNEFFLIENRQQVGWDKYLPGHGMLIWHIDYNQSAWHNNSVNNTESHNYVDIEEACGSWADPAQYSSLTSYYNALAGYAFPGTKGVTSFTDTTKPSMKTWAGASLGLPITDITETGGVISFNVAGGHCDAAVPQSLKPSSVGDDFFVAAWQAAQGAESYVLTVETLVEGGAEGSETADFGSSYTAELPFGWSFVSTKGSIYSSVGNYGDKSPSLKLGSTGEGIMTKTYDGDVKAISFWMKGQGTDAQARVLVDGLLGENWINIETITPTSDKAVTVKIEDVPDGVRQVRITYTKGAKGNLALDDVMISYGGSGIMVLPDYNAVNVGNVTTFRVDKLITGSTEYTYKVAAVDASGRRTAYSASQTVVLGSSAGIYDVETGVQAKIDIAGLTIKYYGNIGDNVVACDLSGRVVAEAVVGAACIAELTMPASGVYILTSPQVREKIYVK